MKSSKKQPTTRMIICNDEDQIAPKTFVCCYINDDDVCSITRVEDISYEQALGLLSLLGKVFSEFIDGFADNFQNVETAEEE